MTLLARDGHWSSTRCTNVLRAGSTPGGMTDSQPDRRSGSRPAPLHTVISQSNPVTLMSPPAVEQCPTLDPLRERAARKACILHLISANGVRASTDCNVKRIRRTIPRRPRGLSPAIWACQQIGRGYRRHAPQRFTWSASKCTQGSTRQGITQPARPAVQTRSLPTSRLRLTNPISLTAATARPPPRYRRVADSANATANEAGVPSGHPRFHIPRSCAK